MCSFYVGLGKYDQYFPCINNKTSSHNSQHIFYTFMNRTGGRKRADLLFCLGPQRALPGVPDDADVPRPRGVAMGLDNAGEGRAADDGLQDLLHVAEGQKSLGPGAGLHQLHGAGNQRDLARAENRAIHLEQKSR